MLGRGQWNDMLVVVGWCHQISFLAWWFQHSLNNSKIVIILTLVVNVANQICISKQSWWRWLASLRFLLKTPRSAASFLSISSGLAQTTSPHTCDCIREKKDQNKYLQCTCKKKRAVFPFLSLISSVPQLLVILLFIYDIVSNLDSL